MTLMGGGVMAEVWRMAWIPHGFARGMHEGTLSGQPQTTHG